MAYFVDAEELETKLKDLIVQQRSGAEFETLVREMLLERDDFRKRADEAVEQAAAAVAQQEAEHKRLARMAAKLGATDDEDDDPLVEELKAKRQSVSAAKSALRNAQDFASSREGAWERLSAIIHETRNLAAAWHVAGPEERKILRDYWVADLLIVAERVPGKKRANRKTALVTLRTAPNAPVHFDLGDAQPVMDSNAASSDAETAPSTSVSRRKRSASRAAADPIRPSAQAACDRTSGSGSDSAAMSAGMSASEPTLPSTTAALRRKPRSLARFIGEPLKAAENSGCEMDSNSSASDRESLPASAALGANAGSDNSFANLWLYGQTSWCVCPP